MEKWFANKMKILFDAHCHINEETLTDEEREALVKDIINSDVEFVCDAAFNYKGTLDSIKHANMYPWCYATIGVHPYDVGELSDEMMDEFRKLAKENPKVRAVGEIGLDYHMENPDKDLQREWFRRQIRLAKELDLPIMVHSREADKETMDILKDEEAFTQRVYIHCFSGSKEMGLEYVKLGAVLGIDGPVTYKNARKTVEVVEAVPIENILIETDSPYLTPAAHRGERNKPSYVEFVARKIAEIKGMSYEDVSRITNENARKYYGI